MTNPNRTALAILVDRSGSMNRNDLHIEATAAIKQLIEDQHELPGQLDVWLFEFDDSFDEVPESDIPAWTLQPRGMTALHDAIGKSISIVGQRLSALPEDERPGTVIFQITTDGLENASVEWDSDALALAITRQQDQYGWQFLFQGANQDSILTARSLGILTANAANFAPTATGVVRGYAAASASITRSRTGN
jgi:hypothetical protein